MTNPHASGCASTDTSLNPEKRLEELKTELADLDSRLRGFVQAEKPTEGLCFAADIHRLRQEKLQKRLEMEYCAVKIRSLANEGAGYLH